MWTENQLNIKEYNLRLNLRLAKLMFGVYIDKNREVVGDARFELATPWTQTKCATKLR